MNSLPEIHDIYIPDGVSAFPLAAGWWIVLGSIVCLFILFKFISWSIKTSKKYYALNKLKKIEVESPVDAAIKISELLRRICNVKFKNASVLYGDEWIAFLNEHTGHKLSEKAAKLLVYAPFMDKKDKLYSSETASELKEFCKNWIGVNL